MDFAQIMADDIVPPYRELIESYNKAQHIAIHGKETKLDVLGNNK
jgi:hypothetical protein